MFAQIGRLVATLYHPQNRRLHWAILKTAVLFRAWRRDDWVCIQALRDVQVQFPAPPGHPNHVAFLLSDDIRTAQVRQPLAIPTAFSECRTLNREPNVSGLVGDEEGCRPVDLLPRGTEQLHARHRDAA